MIEWLVNSAGIVFVSRIFFFLSGMVRSNFRDRKFNSSATVDRPTVSVVVPARNEVNNIENCVRSIFKTARQSSNVEVCVVDDDSSDGTAEILSNLLTEFPQLRVITLDPFDNVHDALSGKMRALNAGILSSTSEIILLTDADCIVHEDWISSHCNHYSDARVGMVCAFTLIESLGVFERIQANEWVYMHAMARGGIAWAQPLGCFGNNISIRRSALESIGGYTNLEFSLTEDLALQQAVSKKGWKIDYLCSEGSSVDTEACSSVRSYLSQHARWARGGKQLGWRASIFVGTSLVFWLALLSAIIVGDWQSYVALGALRIVGDVALISLALTSLKRGDYLRWLVPSVAFFLIMELFIPFTLFPKSNTWKGRVFISKRRPRK